MKKVMLLIICLMVAMVGFSQSFEHPVDYNNFIVEEMNEIVNKNLEYISQSVHSDNLDEVEVKRKNLIGQIQSAYTNISQTKPYEKGEKLQSECVEVLNMYKQIFEVEYQEVNVLKQSSEASFESMEAYFTAQDKAEKTYQEQRSVFIKLKKPTLKFTIFR